MTEAEKIMIDALVKIHELAQSWEGRKEAPYWNLGDIAASALIKAGQQGVQPTKVRCICVDFLNSNPDPVANPDCPIHGAGFSAS